MQRQVGQGGGQGTPSRGERGEGTGNLALPEQTWEAAKDRALGTGPPALCGAQTTEKQGGFKQVLTSPALPFKGVILEARWKTVRTANRAEEGQPREHVEVRWAAALTAQRGLGHDLVVAQSVQDSPGVLSCKDTAKAEAVSAPMHAS